MRCSRSPEPDAPPATNETGELEAHEILPLVYDELRCLARRRLSDAADQSTLQPTALVHEAWLKLSRTDAQVWQCKAHFFRAAAMAMRDILVDRYRRKRTEKHGGLAVRIPLSEDLPGVAPADGETLDLLVFDELLSRLEAIDPVKNRIVMLRFFTGLTMPQIADTLGFSLSHVERQWRFVRAWLQCEIEGRLPEGAS